MNYKKIYESIIDKAKNRKLNSYKEKHHIIPKCIGGSDDETNLVELTAKEHFICHLLLCEIYPNKNTLKSARWAMTCFKSKNHNRKYIISSSQYERIKNEMAILKRGIKRSDEIKKKISNSHKNKNLSEETKKKISAKMKGRVQSEEHKLNQSLSKKGQIPWNKGKNISEETKRKISLARKKKDKHVDKSAPDFFKYAGKVQIPDVACLCPFNISSWLGVECLGACFEIKNADGNIEE